MATFYTDKFDGKWYIKYCYDQVYRMALCQNCGCLNALTRAFDQNDDMLADDTEETLLCGFCRQPLRNLYVSNVICFKQRFVN